MSTEHLPRSPELMSHDDTALLVVDVQQKLVPLVQNHPALVWNIRRLLDGAKILGVPVAATEQYPQGMGSTVAELAERLDEAHTKLSFSSTVCTSLFAAWREREISRVLVVGIETHVCVGQTVLDLLADGWRVYVAVDAVSARGTIDHEVSLRRLEASGATLTTTEAALFEWCRVAGTPQFKQISQLVRELPPGAGA